MPVTSPGGMSKIPEFHIAQPEGKTKGFQLGKTRNIALGSGDTVKVAGKVLGAQDNLGMIDKMSHVVLPLANANGKVSRVALNITDSADALFGPDRAIKDDETKKKAKSDYTAAAKTLNKAEAQLKASLRSKVKEQGKFQEKFEKLIVNMEGFSDRDINNLLEKEDKDVAPLLQGLSGEKLAKAKELRKIGGEVRKTVAKYNQDLKAYDDACAVLHKAIGSAVDNLTTPMKSQARPPATPKVTPLRAKVDLRKDGTTAIMVQKEVKKLMEEITSHVKSAEINKKRQELQGLIQKGSPEVKEAASKVLQSQDSMLKRATEQKNIIDGEIGQWPTETKKLLESFAELEKILSEGPNDIKLREAELAKAQAGGTSTKAADPAVVKEVLENAGIEGAKFAEAAQITPEEAEVLASVGSGKATPAQSSKAYETMINVLKRIPGSHSVLKKLEEAKNLTPNQKAAAVAATLITVTWGLYFIGSKLGVSSDVLFSNRFADAVRQNAANSREGLRYLYASLPGLPAGVATRLGSVASNQGKITAPVPISTDAWNSLAAFGSGASTRAGAFGSGVSTRAAMAATFLARSLGDVQLPNVGSMYSRVHEHFFGPSTKLEADGSEPKIWEDVERYELEDDGLPSVPEEEIFERAKNQAAQHDKSVKAQQRSHFQKKPDQASEPKTKGPEARPSPAGRVPTPAPGEFDLSVLQEAGRSIVSWPGAQVLNATARLGTFTQELGQEIGSFSKTASYRMRNPTLRQLAEKFPNLGTERFIEMVKGGIGEIQKRLPSLPQGIEGKAYSEQVRKTLADMLNVVDQYVPGRADSRVMAGLIVAIVLTQVGGSSTPPKEESANAIKEQLVEALAQLDVRKQTLKDLHAQKDQRKTAGENTPGLDNMINTEEAFFQVIDLKQKSIEEALSKHDFAKAEGILKDIQRLAKGKPKGKASEQKAQDGTAAVAKGQAKPAAAGPSKPAAVDAPAVTAFKQNDQKLRTLLEDLNAFIEANGKVSKGSKKSKVIVGGREPKAIVTEYENKVKQIKTLIIGQQLNAPQGLQSQALKLPLLEELRERGILD